ncbi:EKA-like protein [Blumeria hordei DH14]|uniref:EKA-like protein n=1 Tax=Blumeria graminis f. sp. hordei (strain DH14) TaxID=546991 RepID=N1J8D4_BLUG1|nr:EKA-like protein [Blumeria hordei DH14]
MIESVEIVGKIPQQASIPHRIKESSKFLPKDPTPSEKAAPKAECPPKFRSFLEDKERRATQTAANMVLYSATHLPSESSRCREPNHIRRPSAVYKNELGYGS